MQLPGWFYIGMGLSLLVQANCASIERAGRFFEVFPKMLRLILPSTVSSRVS
jgi:hypothetical protein